MTAAKSAFEKLTLTILLIGGFGTFVSMLLGTADVIGTQFLGTPLPGALELTESTIVLVVFGGLAYAQTRGSHIRVELLYTHMGPRVQAGFDVFGQVLALVFFGLLAWQAWGELMFSWRISEATFGIVRLPLWPTRAILLAGATLLLEQLVLDLRVSLRAVWQPAESRP